MKLEELETHLNRGYTLGFVKQTECADFLGWILLSKQVPHKRYLEVLDYGEEIEFVAEQEKLRTSPYCVRVIELSRTAYESEDYETEDDYRINDSHRFSSLNEIDDFLQEFGLKLENIKWPIEIGAP